MDCQKAKDDINLYVDNMLDDAEKERLFLHIQDCGRCKKELNEALLLKKAFSKLDQKAPPEGLARGAIKKAKKRRMPVFAYASVGVAAAVALVILFITQMPQGAGGMDTAAAPQAYTMEDQAKELGPETQSESLMAQQNDTDAALGAPAPDVADVCRFTVPQEKADGFRSTLDSFIEHCGLAADYTDNGFSVSFTVPETCLPDFEAMVDDAGLSPEGTLYAGCTVQFLFE